MVCSNTPAKEEGAEITLLKFFQKGVDKRIHIIYYKCGYRNGGEHVSPKGRPTDDPKTLNTRIRLSEEDTKRLEFCAEALGITKSEVIRRGIKEVYDGLKK